MLVAANPKETVEYIPKCEQDNNVPDKKKAVFILQFPDLRTGELVDNSSLRFKDAGDGNTVTELTTGTQKVMLLRNCVKGWRNIVDNEGNQIEFKAGTKDELDHSLGQISPEIRDELCGFLRNPSQES